MFKIFFSLIYLFSALICQAQSESQELQQMRSELRIDTSQDFRQDLKNVTKGHFGENILEDQRDSRSGLEVSYDTLKDQNRVNFSLLFNADVRDFTDIVYAELSFGFFLKENKYLDVFINTQSNKYGVMAARASDITIDSETLDNTKESFFSFGVGPTYRTFFIRDLIPIKNLFETIHAGAGLGWFFEDISNEGYFGPGIKAELGIHYRASKNFHIGSKLSWNHFWVKRDEKFVDEPQGIRTLSLTWLALGLDIAIYL
jgi:hypothetical protein